MLKMKNLFFKNFKFLNASSHMSPDWITYDSSSWETRNPDRNRVNDQSNGHS